jgi:acetyl-CoA carboxylase biotin carboxyl carrier protein
MDLNAIKKLVKIIEESTVNSFKYEDNECSVYISKQAKGPTIVQSSYPAQAPMAAPQSAPEAPAAKAAAAEKPAESGSNLHEIKSPIVGTFYRAPAPDADSYVKVGDKVEAGSVLCIVEAMKLMNEIESDMAGTVVKILAENGKPVEYGQPLFLIKPDN